MILQQIYSETGYRIYQSRQSFIEDITRNILVFFSGHTGYGKLYWRSVGIYHVASTFDRFTLKCTVVLHRLWLGQTVY